MPNHVKNIIVFKGEDARIEECMNAIRMDGEMNPSIDFEKIIPAPHDDDYEDQGWYKWDCEHWGTKWNAYDFYEDCGDTEYDGKCIVFLTAWTAPHPVIEKLAEMYPDLTIVHNWADEDIGYNCGRTVYRDGVQVYDAKAKSGSCNDGTDAFANCIWENWDLETQGSWSLDYGEEEFDITITCDCEPLNGGELPLPFSKGTLNGCVEENWGCSR